MIARGRSLSVLALLLLGALLVVSSTQPWIILSLSSIADPVEVPGGDAVPVLAPLGLAVLALGGVLTLVGRVLRYALATLAAAIGVCGALLTTPIVLDIPLSAVAGTVAELTGIAGADAVSGLITSMSGTAWPIITLVVWVVLIANAAFIAASAHRWQRGGRRYRTDAESAAETVHAIDSWDKLSHGTDPTGEDR